MLILKQAIKLLVKHKVASKVAFVGAPLLAGYLKDYADRKQLGKTIKDAIKDAHERFEGFVKPKQKNG